MDLKHTCAEPTSSEPTAVIDAVLPKPTTELFPEALHLSPKQRAVVDVLSGFPSGARVADVAQALNMHVNTARGHLDELVEKNAVFSTTTTAHGRGRPSLVYKLRVPDNRVVAKEYLTLISVIAEHLAGDNPEQAKLLAKRIGKDWAYRMIEEGFSAETFEKAVASLGKHCQEMGFDPIITHEKQQTEQVQLCLRSCPFVNKDGKLVSFACEIHQGMLELQRDSSPLKIILEPLRSNGECHITVRNEQA